MIRLDTGTIIDYNVDMREPIAFRRKKSGVVYPIFAKVIRVRPHEVAELKKKSPYVEEQVKAYQERLLDEIVRLKTKLREVTEPKFVKETIRYRLNPVDRAKLEKIVKQEHGLLQQIRMSQGKGKLSGKALGKAIVELDELRQKREAIEKKAIHERISRVKVDEKAKQALESRIQKLERRLAELKKVEIVGEVAPLAKLATAKEYKLIGFDPERSMGVFNRAKDIAEWASKKENIIGENSGQSKVYVFRLEKGKFVEVPVFRTKKGYEVDAKLLGTRKTSMFIVSRPSTCRKSLHPDDLKTFLKSKSFGVMGAFVFNYGADGIDDPKFRFIIKTKKAKFDEDAYNRYVSEYDNKGKGFPYPAYIYLLRKCGCVGYRGKSLEFLEREEHY